MLQWWPPPSAENTTTQIKITAIGRCVSCNAHIAIFWFPLQHRSIHVTPPTHVHVSMCTSNLMDMHGTNNTVKLMSSV